MIINPTDICAKCGHTFHEHGWNIPVDSQALDNHTDCKAMVGWYCHSCEKLRKTIDVTLVKDGILGEFTWTCPECGEELFKSQCDCYNFELKE